MSISQIIVCAKACSIFNYLKGGYGNVKNFTLNVCSIRVYFETKMGGILAALGVEGW